MTTVGWAYFTGKWGAPIDYELLDGIKKLQILGVQLQVIIWDYFITVV